MHQLLRVLGLWLCPFKDYVSTLYNSRFKAKKEGNGTLAFVSIKFSSCFFACWSAALVAGTRGG